MSVGRSVLAGHRPRLIRIILTSIVWLGCEPGTGATDGAASASCEPGISWCSGSYSITCGEDGAPRPPRFCDEKQGLTCDVDTGTCDGPCAPGRIGRSYIGCDYYPSVTGNDVDPVFNFAVAIANASTETATATIEWGALTEPIVVDVPSGQVRVETLPWVGKLKGCMKKDRLMCPPSEHAQTTLAVKGAYHLRSTQPVTVYQFSPLEYTSVDATRFSYTNDASLLLPSNAMTGRYVVASWGMTDGTRAGSPSLLAITATQDNSTVTVTASSPTDVGEDIPKLERGVPRMFRMQQGDVLELVSRSFDLTGSIVEADKPVQVIGGHHCTNVPLDRPYCDHLEESMLPVEALGSRYAVSAFAVPTLPTPKVQDVRVIAAEADTHVTFDPPVHPPVTLRQPGGYVDLGMMDADFLVIADRKIVVAQYMVGQDVAGDIGDPSISLAVPTDQFRTEYPFHAPTNYQINYVNVIAPLDAQVELDGAALAGFTPVGESGLGVLRVELSRTRADHWLTSDQPVGITVYGYGQYTSYAYPGGLDLREIEVE